MEAPAILPIASQEMMPTAAELSRAVAISGLLPAAGWEVEQARRYGTAMAMVVTRPANILGCPVTVRRALMIDLDGEEAKIVQSSLNILGRNRAGARANRAKLHAAGVI